MKYIFDYNYYILTYPDLINKINNERDGWLHYWKHGINENRKFRDDKKIIDTDFYMKNYPDLEKSNITTHELALRHCLYYGKFEMRKAFFNDDIEENLKEFINKPNHKYIYDPEYLNSNLLDYLKKFCLSPVEYGCEHIMINIYNTLKKNNCIDIDIKLYKYVNKVKYNFINDLLDDFNNNGLNGLIYSKKQLKNIYPTSEIYEYNGKLYCEDVNTSLMSLDEYVRINIYEKTFNELSDILIKLYENKININIKLCVILFIGNYERGIQLIDKLIEYKALERFNLAICFNSYILYDNLIKKIKDNFDNYIIYVSNEFGNDIVPSLLMYNKIIDIYIPEHVIKLQTKSNYEIMTDLTDYLLKKPLNNIINEMNKTTYTFDGLASNSYGNPKYYIHIKNDYFNKELYNIYNENIDMKKQFIEGTIFYISGYRLIQILNFIKKNNYKAFLLNNMYDSNRIIVHKSYIHLLERLFGVHI